MIDKFLRPLKDRIFLPLAEKAGNYLSPNHISVIGFIFGLSACIMILLSHLYAGLMFWLLNRIIDGLDGTVARLTGKESDWGGYLDIMLDFILYATIPLCFTLIYSSGPLTYIALSVMLGIFYINAASWMYLSAVQEKRSLRNMEKELTSISMPTGLIEGAETIILYTLFFIFPVYLSVLFFSAAGLTLVGIFQRMSWGYKNLRTKNKRGNNV